MRTGNPIDIARSIFGLVILLTIILQAFLYEGSLVNFFSYFTVLSNLLLALVLLKPVDEVNKSLNFQLIRGASILYVLLTGVTFVTLLGGKNDALLWWVNIVLHYLAPIVALLDWIIFPLTKIEFKRTLFWLVFPSLYLIYTLIKGSLTDWYPYNFINPNINGNGVVINYILAFLLVLLLASFMLVKVNLKDGLLKRF